MAACNPGAATRRSTAASPSPHALPPPARARLARERYGCLQPWSSDPALYGRLAITEGYARCEKGVVQMLRQLHSKRLEYATEGGEEWLDAAANARLIKNAE